MLKKRVAILIANEHRDVVQAKVGFLLIHRLLTGLIIRISAEA